MDAEFSERFMGVLDSTTSAQASLLTFNFIIDLVVGTSLKFMWGLVNTLQMTCYFTEIKVNLAIHATVFLKKLRIVALGEFIPYDWLNSVLKEKLSSFEEDGMADKIGSVLVILAALVLATLLLLLAGLILKKMGYQEALMAKLKQKLFWNCFIRSSLQAYIKVAFATFSMLTLLKWETFWGVFKTLVIIVTAMLIVSLPIFYWLVLFRNQEALKVPVLRKKIGSLYVGIRHFKALQVYYTVVFLLRRFVYILILLSLHQTPALVCCLLLLMNTAYIVYLGEALPHTTPTGRIMELINETLFQLVSFHLVLSMFRNLYKADSTDLLDPPENAAQLEFDDALGWSMIAHIVALQVVNIAMILANTIRSVKWKLHLRKL